MRYFQERAEESKKSCFVLRVLSLVQSVKILEFISLSKIWDLWTFPEFSKKIMSIKFLIFSVYIQACRFAGLITIPFCIITNIVDTERDYCNWKETRALRERGAPDLMFSKKVRYDWEYYEPLRNAIDQYYGYDFGADDSKQKAGWSFFIYKILNFDLFGRQIVLNFLETSLGFADATLIPDYSTGAHRELFYLGKLLHLRP